MQERKRYILWEENGNERWRLYEANSYIAVLLFVDDMLASICPKHAHELYHEFRQNDYTNHLVLYPRRLGKKGWKPVKECAICAAKYIAKNQEWMEREGLGTTDYYLVLEEVEDA